MERKEQENRGLFKSLFFFFFFCLLPCLFLFMLVSLVRYFHPCFSLFHCRVNLMGNPLTCTCADLDMVEWLRHTTVSLDGEGHKAKYTCTTETGEITDTYRVMAEMTSHWRRCVGVEMFGLALGLFLSQVWMSQSFTLSYSSL